MKGKQRKFVAFFTSIILFVSLLCESAVVVKAESDGWVKLEPYQTDNAVLCTADNDEKMVMMGEEFTEGFYTKYYYSIRSSAQYNLGKKYDTVAFTVGHVDGKSGDGGTMTISVDGEEVKSIPLSYSMMNQTEIIDVKGVSQLSFSVVIKSAHDAFGVANVCAEPSSGSIVPISRVDLDASSVSMKVGEEKLLNASIFPENVTDKTLVWKSADTEVATVSQNGLVKAVAEGTTTITVTGGNNVTASCAVTVSSKDQEFPANPVHHCTKHDDGTDTTDWSYVYFGSYPQTEVTGDALTLAITGADYDANGDAWVNGTQYRRISKSDTTNDENFGDSAYRYFKWERMKWRVLENDGNTLFVMADKGLDCKIYYYEEGIPITWKNCTLRSWLNGSFYNTAFSSGEQGAIVEQTVVNEDTPEYGIEGGNDTNDKVHLLSFGEITNPTYGFCESDDTYSVSRYIKASDYAHTMGININGEGRYEGNCRWWLCSDTYRNYVDVVSINGCAIRKGSKVVSSDHAVVPTLHIDLSSDLWSMEDEKEHTHSFSGTWKADSDNHWKECECGEKTEISRHIFNWVIDESATETSTGLKHEECEDCSYKRNEGTVIDKISGEHTHSYRAWGRNEEAHWKECECGASIEVAPHSFTWVIDEPATETAAGLKHEECEICSYKRNVGTVIDKISGEHTHSFSAAWKSDAQSHWIECGCGEKFAVASHAFSWITDKPATASTTGLKHEECAVCGYKRNQNTVIGKQGNIPAKGQELTDRKSGAVYRVISVETKGGTVEYIKSLDNKTANISIPSTVEIDGISYKVISIAANAFKNNKKITKVIIGNNVTSIGKNSFSGCSKLKTLTIGNNVALIGDNAFSNCTSLKKVTIPVKVKKIGKQAFYGCKKLKTIKINTKKLSGKFVGSKAFAKIDPKAAVKVPSSCLKSYKKLFQKKGFNGKKQKIKK